MDSNTNGTPYHGGSGDNNSSAPSSLDYNQGQGHGFDPRFYGDNVENEQILQALLPALKQLDIHQIPPDVLAHLLKTKRIDQLVASTSGQQRQFAGDVSGQQQQQGSGSYAPHPGQSSHSSSNYGPQGGGRGSSSPDWQANSSQQGAYGGQNQGRGSRSDSQWSRNQGGPSQHSQTRPSRFEQQQQQSGNNSQRNNSALSPFAREFVPQFVPQQQQGRRAYDPNTSGNAGEMDANMFLNQFDMGGSSGDLDADSDCVLSTITDTINHLADNPGDFQRCCRKTTEVLQNYLRDPDTLGVVVTLIFEQSVSNPNFCYSGARLCQAFRKSEIAVAVENTRVTFKNLLIERCQEEFTSCLENIRDPEMQNRAPGVIMFLAELYLNFVVEVSGKSTKNFMFGIAALELMRALVTSKPASVDKTRTVFRTLKLVGWDLDHETRPEVKPEMEKLVKELSYLMVSPDLDSTSKNLLETLFELRKNDWNKAGGTVSPASTASSDVPYAAHNASQYYELPDNVEEEDYSLLIDDEPEEVRQAYEEFLKMTSSLN